MSANDIFLGIDLGTSSVRCAAIDSEETLLALSRVELPAPENPRAGWYQQDAETWSKATLECLAKLGDEISLGKVKSVSVDGTSSTVLLTGPNNLPASKALMYNDTRSASMIEQFSDIIPPGHLTRSASSSLLKSLWLLTENQTEETRISHQADWIIGMLTGNTAVSDENNCLKLGYDSATGNWPGWMKNLPFGLYSKLPRVERTSHIAGHISRSASRQTGIPTESLVVFGTTDSTASTLATGVTEAGQAVTTLGTTMVMKILTDKPVEHFDYGLYSHRLPGNLWLSGGASNAGGNVLEKYFSLNDIETLSTQIDPDKSTGLDYYPLAASGERFPINDPGLEPRLEPRPASDVLFLSAIFEGLANIEKLAYEKIAELSGSMPSEIITSGGKAASNTVLGAIRQRVLGIPVRSAVHTEASYGSALIAKMGWYNQQKKTG